MATPEAILGKHNASDCHASRYNEFVSSVPDDAAAHARLARWSPFTPKFVTTLREGYGLADLRHDAIAGITVAIVALPLAMALAIASGATPEKGLITAIVAGLLISLLGGSRFQIGGPTGAFVVVVYGVIEKHGYGGLIVATAMAGLLLIAAGLARLGSWIRYIPQPVVTGFTAGIAVIIASSQIGDLLGLDLARVPADFVEKWRAYASGLDTVNPVAVAMSLGGLALLIAMRRLAPRVPAFLLVVAGASLAAAVLDLPVTTIGDRFGKIPSSLPAPAWPPFDWETLRALVPTAFTIAFLAGVESLLCAVVADGMTGRRHRPNAELLAQGIANLGSAAFGGLPATGAIARTATNIRAGARSPLAGILHAVFLLLFMLALAPLAAWIPLASLAAVLLMVAWNMSEIERFRHLMLAPFGDRVVLLLTFALTVLVDLTVAIEVGVVLAAVLFMHRMSEAVRVQQHVPLLARDDAVSPSDEAALEAAAAARRAALPEGVQVFEMRGPFFFGAANELADVLDRIGRPPDVFMLLLREVPLIDATGVGALSDFIDHCRRHGTEVVLVELQPDTRVTLERMGVLPRAGVVLMPDFDAARDWAQRRR
jgi:SulP family sulfate permease